VEGFPGQSAPALIRSAAVLSPVPLVPEILLHQAAEPISAWEHTEEALGRTGLPPPYWAFAWPGGQALARYLLDTPGSVRGRRVLDIAAGSGLAAIAAALAGAAAVTACDVDPIAVAAIALNAAANRVAVTARVADLLAGDDGGWPEADVVLAADAFYQRELADRVMSFLEAARARGAAVLAADPGRPYLPASRLTPLASYDVPGLGVLEDAERKLSTVWAPRW
jgi:predicted nicotinamide N-methyase